MQIEDQDRDTRAGLSLFVGRSLPSDLFDLAGEYGVSVGGWTYRSTIADPADRWSGERLRRLGRSLREAAAATRIRLLIPGDPGWPTSTGVDELPCLWLRGDPDVARLFGRSVAVTGTSSPSGDGARLAARLVAVLADAGWSIITTTDAGIDAQVTADVLRLPTTGLVQITGGGLDTASSPAIAAGLPAVIDHGTIISAAPPGARPYRARVRARNELLYRLGTVSVLVEARSGSGHLPAARNAAKAGRLVVCAVPGSTDAAASQGCHTLIREGVARPIDDAADLLALLGRNGGDSGRLLATPGSAFSA